MVVSVTEPEMALNPFELLPSNAGVGPAHKSSVMVLDGTDAAVENWGVQRYAEDPFGIM